MTSVAVDRDPVHPHPQLPGVEGAGHERGGGQLDGQEPGQEHDLARDRPQPLRPRLGERLEQPPSQSGSGRASLLSSATNGV